MAPTRCGVSTFPHVGSARLGPPTRAWSMGKSGVPRPVAGRAKGCGRAWSFHRQRVEHFIIDQEVLGARLGQARLQRIISLLGGGLDLLGGFG